ncbi:hypothetical protein P3T36_003013 [Kitasatospora sp. MAP12-15]|uniref:DUF4232 domain-containing protein n=1 Tax=unclassified Kitasatospora TaxID=2633591 RepID=UPI002476C6D1|nr:DUF4232 domain-containing protein [Kitasatospora sp. MAP12-44]MDH6110644.1 hypothetical protein [Kitasatospora sp. MAP12-44]
MRTKIARQGLSATVLVAAGLMLTACGPNGSVSATISSSTGSNATQSSTGGTTSASNGSTTPTGSSSAGKGSGTGAGSSAGADCHTVNLSFSSSGGMAQGEVLINLKNVGSTTCSLHGFPGVDLKSQYGTVSAVRSTMAVPTVSLSPGQTTNFTLHYPVNNTGGSGVTFTSAVVTPPNETHSHTMSLGFNVPADSGSSPAITVDPVGAGK